MQKLHHYVVTGKLPPRTSQNPNSWARTMRWGVVASTPELAGMQVRLSVPDVVIDSIAHRGEIDFFDEMAKAAP